MIDFLILEAIKTGVGATSAFAIVFSAIAGGLLAFRLLWKKP